MDETLEELDEAELQAVVALVQALVTRDVEALTQAGAYDGGADPYVWTRGYGKWGEVHLVLPPGNPSTWAGGVYRGQDGWVGVDVAMWTVEEGRSDLTAQLALAPGSPWPQARFEGLHVM